jgi:predicted aspartyl protease
MRAVPLLVILASSAAATPLAAQPASVTNGVFQTVKQTQSGQVDSTTQAQDVRIRKDVNDRMTVSVRLSGTPFRFLVDTGADRTAISRDVAARLGLAVTDTASLHSMTGVSTVQTATVPNLEISNSDMRIVDAPLLDAAYMGADGILGTDSLHSQRVIFDFDKNLMTIVPAEGRVVPKDEGTIVVTGRIKNGRLIVTDAIADDNRITVILDTGSQVSVGNEALRLRLGNHGQLRETGSVQLQSVTGDLLTGEYTFVKKLTIGDVGLSNLAVVFADAHTFKQLGLDKRPALLLGMNALRAFKKVSIDFANRKLRVMLPETGSLDAVRLAAR